MKKELDSLKDMAFGYGFCLSDGALGKFGTYMDWLIEWNERINLTAITDPLEIVEKHFLDSILVLLSNVIADNLSVLDVGAGAGFPSIPLKIVMDSLRITQLDSLGKRLRFLSGISEKLEMDNAQIHGRAEDLSKREYRETFDIVTARAVAPLPELCELCLPFVSTGGYFIAMKGQEAENETVLAGNAIGILGGKVDDVIFYSLPSGYTRSLVIIEKISQTPMLYPRRPQKIRKSPL